MMGEAVIAGTAEGSATSTGVEWGHSYIRWLDEYVANYIATAVELGRKKDVLNITKVPLIVTRLKQVICGTEDEKGNSPSFPTLATMSIYQAKKFCAKLNADQE